MNGNTQSRRRERPDSWVTLIDVIKTPLAFMVFCLLVTDTTIGALAWGLPAESRFSFVLVALGCILVFLIPVVGLSIWRLEALLGVKPLSDYSDQFASDLHAGLEGAFRMLEPAERIEAWAVVTDVIASYEGQQKTYKEFCVAVGNRVKKVAKIADRQIHTQGPITEQTE
jgi:hypothetical protein